MICLKIKKIIYTSFIVLLLVFSLYLIKTVTLKNNYPNFIHLIASKFTKEKYAYKLDIMSLYINSLKENNHFKITKKKETIDVSNIAYNNTNEPIIYIYNTHSNEEYSYQKNDIYNIVPNVKTASYILEDELKKLGLNSIVETENTIDIVNKNGLNYADSYKVSRTLLEEKKNENDSLIYYIDVHRDSVSRSNTTTTINGVTYARTMFLLGLENPNYKENLKMMESMENYLNTNYPGLSRGIYKKQGKGVNGVYNQDFSPNVFLVEVGGVGNTIDEVSNSLKVIASCLYNYINSNKES